MASTFNTVNGQQTVDSMAQQLKNVGYNGATDPSSILTAYSSTTGGSVTPAGSNLPTFNNNTGASTSGGGSGGGGGNSGGGGGNLDTQAALAQIQQSLGAFSSQASGVTQADLAERKREFDQTLQWQMQMWQNQGLPQLVIQQKAQALAEQEFQTQTQLAQQSMALQQAGVLGYYVPPGTTLAQATQQQWTPGGLSGPGGTWDASTGWDPKGYTIGSDGYIHNGTDGSSTGIKAAAGAPAGMTGANLGALANATPASSANATPTTLGANGLPAGAVPTLAAQQQQFAQGLAQAQLGLQYQQTAAQLGGPENTFQLSNFMRGAQGNPNVPVFLQNLASNTRMPTFQATGTTPPNVLSAASIANQLQGGGAGFDANQSLSSIQNIANQGAQKLAPGSLERLTPDELAAFGSGLKAVGNSLPTFLQQYTNSRLGQSAMTGDVSLAA